MTVWKRGAIYMGTSLAVTFTGFAGGMVFYPPLYLLWPGGFVAGLMHPRPNTAPGLEWLLLMILDSSEGFYGNLTQAGRDAAWHWVCFAMVFNVLFYFVCLWTCFLLSPYVRRFYRPPSSSS